MHTQKAHQGFTLVELLVVIAIIAGLAVVVMVALSPSRYRKNTQPAPAVNTTTTAQPTK